MDENKVHNGNEQPLEQSDNIQVEIPANDSIDDSRNLTENMKQEENSKRNEEQMPESSAVDDFMSSMGINLWRPKKTAIKKEKSDVNSSKKFKIQKEATFIENFSSDENKEENLNAVPAVSDEGSDSPAQGVLEETTGEQLEEIDHDGAIDLELFEDNEANIPQIRGVQPQKRGVQRKLLIIPALVMLSFLVSYLYGIITDPRPPSEDVVATYSGKNLTKEELLAYIQSRGYKEEEHGICEEHGFEHDKCDKTEECETHPIHSLEAYKQIIKMIAVQKIVDDWAKENGITQKDEVKHDFKHLVEEVSLDKLVDKVHKDQLSPDKIDKLEIQKYYDANRDKYMDRPFSEVEDEIRNILAAEADKTFFPEYIERLKKESALDVNYDILKVDDPTETEMRSFYEKNMDKYLEAKKVRILEIRIDISGSEDDARRKAEEALTKIRGGESFEDVAKRYSSNNQLGDYYVKQGEKGIIFEDMVFNLQVNEVSSVFKNGSSYYIIRVSEKKEGRQKVFGEVLNEIKTEVIKEKEDKQYELKKNEALFSIHGKRFTLGEFKEEFKELSPEIQARFTDFEAKKSLIDELITKELLLEESGDDSADKEGNEEVEELKNQYIQQILHKEEIDEKIGEITDEEANKFYEEKKGFLVDPPKAQISLIRVEQGTSDAERTRARQRIDEALQMLNGGTDFAVVAKEYSNDPTAPAGGELSEWLYQEHLDPVLEENIFKLKPDEISDVFEYQGGYYVVKMRQKEEQRQKTFEETKEQLKEALLDEKHHKMEAELEDELFKKSQLVIYDSSLKRMLKGQTTAKK